MQTTYGGGFEDGYVTKFNIQNQLTWSTFYGGTADDYPMSCKVDNLGNLFVWGWTNSNNFSLQNAGGSSFFQNTISGDFDYFILKFNTSGVRLWSTFMGGVQQERAAENDGIAINSKGIFFIGTTSSSDMPTQSFGTNGYYKDSLSGNEDVFIIGIDNNLSIILCTYVGGSNIEAGEAIATDLTGNIYITGTTKSSNFPVANLTNAYSQSYLGGTNTELGDAFLSAFDFNSFSLGWSTFVGGNNSSGSGSDVGNSLSTFQNSKLFLTGASVSNNPSYPLYDPGNGAYFQSTLNFVDVVITEFDISSLVLSANNNQNKNNIPFSVFPNPSNNTINILTGNNFNEKNIGLQLLNSMGQIVYKSSDEKFSQKTIDISKLSVGLYFLVVNTEKENYTIKVVKQ